MCSCRFRYFFFLVGKNFTAFVTDWTLFLYLQHGSFFCLYWNRRNVLIVGVQFFSWGRGILPLLLWIDECLSTCNTVLSFVSFEIFWSGFIDFIIADVHSFSWERILSFLWIEFRWRGDEFLYINTNRPSENHQFNLNSSLVIFIEKTRQTKFFEKNVGLRIIRFA